MIPITVINKNKKIHFIGIGGIGMSGLAEYHLRIGNYVSGSDLIESDITKRLKELGADIFRGHSGENINSTIDVIVYSSAIRENNPEIVKAKELNIKVLKRSEMLGEIVNEKYLIAVAGTHGKTTTTAMIGKVLVDAGYDPLIFVGGSVSLFNGGASRYGEGIYAVVEADEYDRSFLSLKPDISVITSIDEDHLDIYKNIDDIKMTFKQFCEGSKSNSKIVYCGDDDNITSFIHYVKREKFSYGFSNKNYLKITEFKINDGEINFSMLNSTALYKNINLRMIGSHNVLNSAGCFAALKLLKIDFDTFRKSIYTFKTVDRRLQLKYQNGIKVFDDYAHHPKEIESSLRGLRNMYARARIVSIFQPHLYSRTRDFFKQFAKSLSIADKIFLMEIYPAREEPIEGVTSELIDVELKKLGSNVIYGRSKDELFKCLSKEIKHDDIIVFQGAGDITLLCNEFINEIK